MRRNILFILVAFVFASSMSAQIFVGGSLELNINSVRSKNGSVTRDISKETNFTFSPKGGFFLNDEMAVGAGIAFENTRITDPANGINGYETVETNNLISFSPFFRYYALEFGSVSIFGEAYVSLGFGGKNTKTGSVASNDESIVAFGAGVMPGASYKLTENIEIEAFLGGLKLTRETSEENDVKTINSNVNLSLSSDFGLGFIYSF